MPVPKKRTSKAKRDQRRHSSNHKLLAGASNHCPNCKTYKRPHQVCPSCGYYKGKPVHL